jgi:hypothetical protein
MSTSNKLIRHKAVLIIKTSTPVLVGLNNFKKNALSFDRTLVVMVACSLYLGGFHIPLPAYTRKEKCHVTKYPLFQLMPVS